jgi:hypothetical protein
MTADRDPLQEHRIVTLCCDVDVHRGRGDCSRLWAYGYKGIAELAGCDVRQVRDAVARKRLDPGDLLDVARWVTERRSPDVVRDDRQGAPAILTISSHGGPMCGGALRLVSTALDLHRMEVYTLECARCGARCERLLPHGTCTGLDPDHRPAYTLTITSEPSTLTLVPPGVHSEPAEHGEGEP